MKRGFFLISTLWLAVVLLMLVVVLVSRVRGQLVASREHQDEIAALCAAETGIVDAILQLESDQTWVQGFPTGKALPSGTGTYTVEFFSGSGQPGPQHSVNNLRGLGMTATYRGDIPAGTALLVVTGRAGAAERRLEAIVGGGGALVTDSPLLSSGRIQLQGELRVDGIESLQKMTATDAGIHSNSTGNGTKISWSKLDASDKAVVSGKVSTSGTAGDAIVFNPNMGPDVSVGSFQTGAAQKPLPFQVDITQTVDRHASSPGPAIPATGTLTAPAGDHHYSGNQTINGDLVLEDGACLYVDGNLTVNGSIKGNGSVFVKGQTSLYGDVSVVADDSKKVALFSHGSVKLSGFDGTAALEQMAAADPPNPATPPGAEFGELYAEFKIGMDGMSAMMRDNPPDQWRGNGNPLSMAFDLFRVRVAEDRPWSRGYLPTTALGTAGKMRDRMPPGPTGDFLRKKLDSIDLFCHSGNYAQGDENALVSPTTYEEQVQQWLTTGSLRPDQGGILDSITTQDHAAYSDANHLAVLAQVRNMVDSYSFDRAGSAFFQGLVYTNGSVYANNDITVLGVCIAMQDGTQGPVTFNGVTLQPGDVYLGNNCRLTYVKDMFSSGLTSLSNAGIVGVITWIRR